MNETNNMNAICEECGCCDEELFELVINGETRQVCADCAEANGYIRCEDCGEWVKDSEAIRTANGSWICESCYDDDYFTCDDCGEVHHNDELCVVNEYIRWADTLYVCSDCVDRRGCYIVCDDCGETVTEDYVHQDTWNSVCDRCYDDRWTTCEDCGCLIRQDEAIYQDGYIYCDSCAPREETRNFHDYGYKPWPEFQFRNGESHDVLTFGTELEVDDGDDHNDLCDELANIGMPIYMKHDGSLGDEGVEIVTHPGSLAWHLYEMRWAEITRICKKHGYRSHDAGTCGLHIHVGRKAFGPDMTTRKDVAMKLVLLANNLKAPLTTFSRRKASQLENWASFPELDINESADDFDLWDAARQSNTSRYRAVNLRNDATVEFRIFRGTLKRDTIAASLQLVNNLCKYAMTHSFKECAFEATFRDILDVEAFKELNTYAATRGLI